MLAVFAMALIPASAYEFTVDGIYYNVESLTDLTCSVTSGDESYTGDIVIPDKVTYKNKTLTVTEIGYGAFEGCSGLTSFIPSILRHRVFTVVLSQMLNT